MSPNIVPSKRRTVKPVRELVWGSRFANPGTRLAEPVLDAGRIDAGFPLERES